MSANSHSKGKVQANSSWFDYVKITRIHMFPMGNDLVYAPCLWGIAMAAFSAGLSFEDVKGIILPLVISSICVHSAACILSDICDVDFDRQVERTKLRPLCTGAITVTEAWSIIILLLAPCLWLITQTNNTAATLALFGLFPLHALYPLSKRWMEMPQIMLGLTMNWGYVVAWACVSESINIKVATIFMLGATCFGIVYDTIYACQDRKDDVKAGVKSSAVYFGSHIRPVLMVMAAVFTICLAWAGHWNGQGVLFNAISVGSTSAFYVWLFSTWNIDSNDDCLQKFKAHGYLSEVIALGMFLDLIFVRANV